MFICKRPVLEPSSSQRPEKSRYYVVGRPSSINPLTQPISSTGVLSLTYPSPESK